MCFTTSKHGANTPELFRYAYFAYVRIIFYGLRCVGYNDSRLEMHGLILVVGMGTYSLLNDKRDVRNAVSAGAPVGLVGL